MQKSVSTDVRGNRITDYTFENLTKIYVKFIGRQLLASVFLPALNMGVNWALRQLSRTTLVPKELFKISASGLERIEKNRTRIAATISESLHGVANHAGANICKAIFEGYSFQK